jgi:hypothetical protein
MVEKEEILSVLKNYRHGFRTDLNKKVLNNRDACAFIVWMMGPSKVSVIINILREWRGKVNIDTAQFPGGIDLCFTYLFNTSYTGGYGCVGESALTRGNWMSNMGWNGVLAEERMERYKQNYGQDFRVFFRRTYWFRSAPGVYAPTVECAKRMTELQLG